MALSIDFTGSRVVVVGGTSGINLGIAQAFGEHGADVAVASRSPDKVARAVEDLAARGPGRAIGQPADVRDPQAVAAFFDQVADAFGGIDVLISGAAGNFPARAGSVAQRLVDIDLLGSFHVLRAAFPHLRKPGASVIQISAPQAFLAMELQAHVCAAKAGVDMLTRTLAMEWGPAGVRINSIAPGPIAGTEGMKRLAPLPQVQQLVESTVPLRRQGTLEDISKVALSLASDLAGYISGVVLPVDGGWATG